MFTHNYGYYTYYYFHKNNHCIYFIPIFYIYFYIKYYLNLINILMTTLEKYFVIKIKKPVR